MPDHGAVVIYSPAEQAVFSMRMVANASELKPEELSWRQRSVNGAAGHTSVSTFVNAVLRLPPVDASPRMVADGLREAACAAAEEAATGHVDTVCLDRDAAVLFLITEKTCAACQALLPTWEDFLGALTAPDEHVRHGGDALLCPSIKQGSEGGRRCLAPAHADITARRLSPALELAVRAVPILALLVPDGYTTSAGRYFAQYQLGRSTFGAANVTAWARTQLQELRVEEVA